MYDTSYHTHVYLDTGTGTGTKCLLACCCFRNPTCTPTSQPTNQSTNQEINSTLPQSVPAPPPTVKQLQCTYCKSIPTVPRRQLQGQQRKPDAVRHKVVAPICESSPPTRENNNKGDCRADLRTTSSRTKNMYKVSNLPTQEN
jgi:hypothetical protein